MSDDNNEIVFEEGIIGVPRARRFQLLEREDSPMRVLRSLDVEGFALPVVDPALVVDEYRPRIGARIRNAIQLEDSDPVLVLLVATIESDGATANLRAPLLINVRCRRAAQVILDDRSFSLRAPLAREPRKAGVIKG